MAAYDERQIQRLTRQLLDRDYYIRRRAADIVEQIGIRAIPAMLEALREIKSAGRKRSRGAYYWDTFAHVLGRLGEKGVAVLIEMLQRPEGGARQAAASALYLSKTTDVRAVLPLLPLLRDNNKLARSDAARALGNLRDPRAIEPLIDALHGDYSYARAAACEALSKIGGKRALVALLKAMSDEDAVVRSSAAEALGNFSEEEVIEPLVKAIENENEASSVLYAATEALGKIGNRHAVGALISMQKRISEYTYPDQHLIDIAGESISDIQQREEILPNDPTE